MSRHSAAVPWPDPPPTVPTSSDGSVVETDPYTSQDMMASVCHALDISLETRFTATNGRPMKIANGGKVIKGLFS